MKGPSRDLFLFSLQTLGPKRLLLVLISPLWSLIYSDKLSRTAFGLMMFNGNSLAFGVLANRLTTTVSDRTSEYQIWFAQQLRPWPRWQPLKSVLQGRKFDIMDIRRFLRKRISTCWLFPPAWVSCDLIYNNTPPPHIFSIDAWKKNTPGGNILIFWQNLKALPSSTATIWHACLHLCTLT